MTRRTLLPAGRWLLVADLLVIAWMAFWCVVGVRVGVEVRDLGRISTSVDRVGQAVSQTGAALAELDGLPVVGDELAAPAAPIREAGEAARATAQGSRTAASDLSVLLALSIALAPSLPMLLLYLPDRIETGRDRRSIARAGDRGPMSGELTELLARRALVHVPLHRLRAITDDPLADVAAGRHNELAQAELRRLGVREHG